MDDIDGWYGWMIWMDDMDWWYVWMDGMDGWYGWMVWMDDMDGWMVWMDGMDGWYGWMVWMNFLESWRRRRRRAPSNQDESDINPFRALPIQHWCEDIIQVTAAEADDREFVYIEWVNLVPHHDHHRRRSSQNAAQMIPQMVPDGLLLHPALTWL